MKKYFISLGISAFFCVALYLVITDLVTKQAESIGCHCSSPKVSCGCADQIGFITDATVYKNWFLAISFVAIFALVFFVLKKRESLA